MYKRLYFTGIVAYVFMFFLAALFYKERIIFMDTTFLVFHIIKEGFFHIEAYRFGDAINQVMPVLAIKARASLDTVMLCYSLNFIVYYFICYFICGTVLKRYDMALAVLLLNILFVSETFYWIPSEVPQGGALLMALFAYVSNMKEKSMEWSSWIIITTCLITLAFFHPLLSVMLLYAVIFFKLRGEGITPKKILYIIVTIFFSLILIKGTLFRTEYERHSMSGLKNFISLFPDYFTMYSNKRFLGVCVTKYYWIPVIFSAVLICYISTRDWKKLFFFAGTFFAYLLLVNISYPTAATPLFYIENLYLPLSLVLALPFIFDVLPALQQKKLALPVVVLIVLTSCLRMYTAHDTYTHRLDYQRRVLDKYGDKKVIVKATQQDRDTLLMLWSNPYEFLLLSACERNKPASILIDENPERLVGQEKRKKS